MQPRLNGRVGGKMHINLYVSLLPKVILSSSPIGLDWIRDNLREAEDSLSNRRI